MADCAYCGSSGLLTREHVVPSFLYELVDKNYIRQKNGWLEATKSRIPSELKVKDVCANCNNIRLSSLDGYGKNFLLTNDLTSPILNNTLTITYNYHLLLRWLLKIQFNSSRASQEKSHPAAQYKDYILFGKNPPTKDHVFLFGYLLSPHVVADPNSPAFASSKDGLANPFFVRITRSIIPKNYAKVLLLESVGFGGLFLYVGHITRGIKPKLARKIRERVLRSDSGILLTSKASSVKLRAAPFDFMDMIKPQSYREEALRSTGIDPFHDHLTIHCTGPT